MPRQGGVYEGLVEAAHIEDRIDEIEIAARVQVQRAVVGGRPRSSKATSRAAATPAAPFDCGGDTCRDSGSARCARSSTDRLAASVETPSPIRAPSNTVTLPRRATGAGRCGEHVAQ